MPETKYYLGFAASDELESRMNKVLTLKSQNSKQSFVPTMEAAIDLFIKELLKAFLVDTTDSVGLSRMATKIVHSTADVIAKTSHMLIPQLLKKRSNEELGPAIDFINEIYVPASENNKGQAFAACEVDEATFRRFERVISEIRAGNGKHVQGELNELLAFIVDLQIDGFMKRSINTMKHGFVANKIINGAVSTCHAAGHSVVNKVFKKLEPEQLNNVAEYLDTQLVYTQAKEASTIKKNEHKEVDRQPVC